jgi:hypothetical protein
MDIDADDRSPILTNQRQSSALDEIGLFGRNLPSMYFSAPTGHRSLDYLNVAGRIYPAGDYNEGYRV